jgi:hypothetical protein
MKQSLKDREIQGFKLWSARWQTSGMTSFLKTSRPSSWAGWSGSPGWLTTMEAIILNELTRSGIVFRGIEKDGGSQYFLIIW